MSDLTKKQGVQLQRVKDGGDCDGRSRRLFIRLEFITSGKRKTWVLTSAGRTALKGV